MLILLCACANENQPGSHGMSTDPPKLALHVALDNSSLMQDDTINLNAYVVNESGKNVTILRSSVEESFESTSWKRNDMNVTVYNGPATSIVAPGDSAFFGYQLNEFFDNIPPGQSTLSVKLNVFLEDRTNPVVLSDQITLMVKDKELSFFFP
jgi:hypothetical protein